MRYQIVFVQFLAAFLAFFRAEARTCEDLSDSICRGVWSSKNRGNIEFGREKVYIGKTGKSELSFAQRFDVEALLQAVENLPADLRQAVRPLARRMKSHLQKENHSKAWLRKFAIIQYEINNAFIDVAEQRTFRRRPDLELKGKREDDKTFEDFNALQTDYFAVERQVLDAKYSNHPNWVRVKETFEQVRRHLISMVEGFPLEKKAKRRMRSKLESVELTLPYQDPKLFGARESCGTTELNAYYRLSRNKVTVCAGYFNSLQSKGKIFSTLAHEIAHAIDAATLSFDAFAETELAQLMMEVSNESGKLNCKNWSARKKKSFREPRGFFSFHSRIDKIGGCFVDRSDLSPLTLEALVKPSESYASQYLGQYAGQNAFTRLAQPNIFKYEKLIRNEFFDRPDRLSAKMDDSYVFVRSHWGYFDSISLFMQEYRCKMGAKKLATKDREFRSKVFAETLAEVEKLYALYWKIYLSFQGRESSRLQQYNLSRPSFENWADWMGRKSFTRFLKEVSADVKRDMIRAVNASECQRAGLNTVAPQLVKIEKRFSNEEHPESRSRRLGIFTDYVAKVMKCKRGKEIRSRQQQCEL